MCEKKWAWVEGSSGQFIAHGFLEKLSEETTIIKNLDAYIERKDDKSWEWFLIAPLHSDPLDVVHGEEKSAMRAITAAEVALKERSKKDG